MQCPNNLATALREIPLDAATEAVTTTFALHGRTIEENPDSITPQLPVLETIAAEIELELSDRYSPRDVHLILIGAQLALKSVGVLACNIDKDT